MSISQLHITILCSRLDLPGGIERSVVNTVNLFVEKGNKVTFLVLDSAIESFYPVHQSVNVIQLPLTFGITNEGNIISRKIKFISDIIKLKRKIRLLNPDVIISSEYPYTVAIILAGQKKYSRIYAWEHHHYAWLKKNRFWTFLFKRAYHKLHGIICLNQTEAEHYYKIAPSFVIPNFIDTINVQQSSGNSKQILSIGWLIHRKGIDMMLKVAKNILQKYSDWTWKLIGTGEMEEKVKNFIIIEKLEGKFILEPPIDSNLENKYLNSSIFVLSSRSEAFPMVLLEAMAHGVPCISFNCPSGPADIITHNVDGLLVEKENTEKLADAISFLITNEEMRKKMGEKAVENVQRFSPENIYELWKQLF
jgi:glycosyltransferase involved in cell wall biosynthesis